MNPITLSIGIEVLTHGTLSIAINIEVLVVIQYDGCLDSLGQSWTVWTACLDCPPLPPTTTNTHEREGTLSIAINIGIECHH